MSENVKMCPLLKRRCLRDECVWWVRSIKHTPPPEAKPVNFDTCAMLMIPDMLLDVIKNTGGTQAAVESSRNETVSRQDVFIDLIAGASRARLKSADSEGQ